MSEPVILGLIGLAAAIVSQVVSKFIDSLATSRKQADIVKAKNMISDKDRLNRFIDTQRDDLEATEKELKETRDRLTDCRDDNAELQLKINALENTRTLLMERISEYEQKERARKDDKEAGKKENRKIN